MLIIAIFLFSINGCGYKAPPYYIEDAPAEDENVKFIIQKESPKQDTIENDKI